MGLIDYILSYKEWLFHNERKLVGYFRCSVHTQSFLLDTLGFPRILLLQQNGKKRDGQKINLTFKSILAILKAEFQYAGLFQPNWKNYEGINNKTKMKKQNWVHPAKKKKEKKTSNWSQHSLG